MANATLRGRNVVLDGGYLGPATIRIRDGMIAGISTDYTEGLGTHSAAADEKVLDAGDYVLMPGLVDSHVHVNEPGRTEWEGYDSATRAAAVGGITTIVDMPLNSIPPTTTLEGFYSKKTAARGKCYTDVAFWGGVVPDNQMELRPLIREGVVGFKCFMVNSGVSEFPHVTEEDLDKAFLELQGTGTVLLLHAELEAPKSHTSSNGDPTLYRTYLQTRPDIMEVRAIEMICRLCLKYMVRCHIVHLATAEAIPIIRKAREKGAPLTVETCHHYLNLEAETVPRGATEYKCCPPIRGKSTQVALWQALRDGVVDMVVSDHSPCTPDLKLKEEGDFLKAWGGVSSVQFGLSLMCTANSKQREPLTLHERVALQCQNTAKLCGLDSRKGHIRIGYDADFVIWNPDESFKVETNMIQHKNKLTPYLGKTLQGVVKMTILRGEVIYSAGQIIGPPRGMFLP